MDERCARAIVASARRVPGLRRLALCPAVAVPGYWLVTAIALLWAGLGFWRGFRSHRLWVFPHMPRWAYGRGGTTMGAVFLTTGPVPGRVLEHEAVHRLQWRRYGLALIVLYAAAGVDARSNVFEIEAGLARGGYGADRG